MAECEAEHLYYSGDGLVHIERPRHHLPLCSETALTHGWQVVKQTPVSCLACLGTLHAYWDL